MHQLFYSLEHVQHKVGTTFIFEQIWSFCDNEQNNTPQHKATDLIVDRRSQAKAVFRSKASSPQPKQHAAEVRGLCTWSEYQNKHCS